MVSQREIVQKAEVRHICVCALRQEVDFAREDFILGSVNVLWLLDVI